jgi:long-chain acyl-CoA synthetase
MDKPWTKFYDEGVPVSLQPYPEHPLYAFLEQTAARYPNKPAVHFKPSHLGIAKSSLTYAKLNILSDRMAAALAALGVKKGDRVAIFMPNIPQFVIAFYGVLKAGGVVVATNPAYTEPEIEHQLKDSGAETMICMSLFYPKVQKVLANTRLKNVIVTNIKDYMSGLLRPLFTLTREKKDGHRVELSPGHLSFMDLMAKYSASQRPKVDVGPDDRALFQYSGGTTGVPKAAIALHRNLVANTLQIRAWFTKCRDGEETVLLAIPLFHVYGLVAGMCFAVRSGASMVLVPNPRDQHSIVDAIDTYQPTIFPGVPRMYNGLNNFPGIEGHKTGSIRWCISGSEPLLLDVKSKFESLTGGRLVEGFGMSECPTAAIVNPLIGLNKPGSIGLPFPDTDVRIISLEDEVTPLKTGEVGELCLRGPMVMYGYHGMPTETQNTLRRHPDDPDGPPWLHTGDTAMTDEDGFVFIVGRKKELIKVGGLQVWPRHIEDELIKHPAVLEAAVAGVPDRQRGGEWVKAWVVLKPGASATEDELKKYLSEKLVAYKVPRQIEFRSELPKSAVLKVLRRTLVEQETTKATA